MVRPRLSLARRGPSSGGALRDERGAVALEAAVVFLMLFFILAGVVDVSMFFKDTYSVSTAARAGARNASADPMNPQFAKNAATQAASAMVDLPWQRIQDIWVYKANPSSTTAPATCLVNCVSFTVTAPGVVTNGTGLWLGRNACIPNLSSDPAVDSVGVQVRYRHDATVMFGDNAVVSERVTMRLEQLPRTQQCLSL